MPVVDAVVRCPVYDSFRVRQVAGMFDLPLAAEAVRRFAVEVPGDAEPWQIGVIVGPSGSGKSTVARAAYGAAAADASRHDWPDDRAAIDCLGELPIRQIARVLGAVGFSSPPAWVRPYRALSTGEQFRMTLARTLLAHANPRESDDATNVVFPGGPQPARAAPEGSDALAPAPAQSPEAPPRGLPPSSDVPRATAPDPAPPNAPVAVFDEFTSVVDRTVARIGSAALSKAIRAGAIGCRFVAVTCHYDVVPWLEPDWVLDMASGTLARGRLRRPGLAVDVARCPHRAWRTFAPHHYLSGELHRSATCYLARVEGRPAAFCATLAHPPVRRRRRVTRLVVLPDYQGIGLGPRLLDLVAAETAAAGHAVHITTGHPALVAALRRSPRWRFAGAASAGHARHRFGGGRAGRGRGGSAGRRVCSFRYVGDRGEGAAGPPAADGPSVVPLWNKNSMTRR